LSFCAFLANRTASKSIGHSLRRVFQHHDVYQRYPIRRHEGVHSILGIYVDPTMCVFFEELDRRLVQTEKVCEFDA